MIYQFFISLIIYMRFRYPSNPIIMDYVSDKIYFGDNDDYHYVRAIRPIPKGEIIMIEYPEINLFGENEVDKGLQTIKKYRETMENKLYPRSPNYIRTDMIKDVHKIIKNTDIKIKRYFEKISKDEIEFYYAKYIYNTFEGHSFGPLTLPKIAKINHSCNPNVELNFNQNSGQMIIRAKHNIKRNSELFITYLMNKSIKNHKEYLYEHYGFYCSCDCNKN